jgi:hypothetical protein
MLVIRCVKFNYNPNHSIGVLSFLLVNPDAYFVICFIKKNEQLLLLVLKQQGVNALWIDVTCGIISYK